CAACHSGSARPSSRAMTWPRPARFATSIEAEANAALEKGAARGHDICTGQVAEWLKALAWNACIRETVSWVRIPPCPPQARFCARHRQRLMRLTLLKGKAMSDEEMKAELERLRNENAALKKGASTGIRMKVSEKGAVSIYGMGRFPVTLYKEQWLKLLDMSADIRAFITANDAQLKKKDLTALITSARPASGWSISPSL